MQTIKPFLWFNSQAEAAAEFYVSVFPNSRIVTVNRCGEAGPGPVGSVLLVEFELDGQRFFGLNGGPQFSFTEAVSFTVECDTQEDVDRYWERLSAGGKEIECGWLKDQFGLFWQITPRIMGQLLGGSDAAGRNRAMQAMMGMRKLDIAALQKAYDGR